MGRKAKKKDKKAKKKNYLDELETVTYEQQILDNNKQLTRLRARNEELEADADKLKGQLQQLEENKADLTAHLQVILQKKTEEAKELQERLRALEKLRKEEQLAFKKKEEMMEHEFKTMENNLTAEIKLAAGKLNALEDYRLARIDLMKKFEQQEKDMNEQEQRHRETLYETEKKLIIGKAKMQNELEKRINELAESFREATSLRLADATRRAVRENVALHREMNGLLSHCGELDTRVEDYKERERSLRLQASLYEAEARIALEKVMKQNRTIEKLSSEHHLMSKAIGRARRAEMYAERSELALEEARRSCTEAETKTRLLEQNVERERLDRDDSMREVRDNCREIERLSRILAEAKFAIKQALQMQADTSYRDEDEIEELCSSCFLDVKEKLLRSLLDILAGYQETTTEYEETTEFESEPVENLYEFGDLGLIPTKSREPSLASSRPATASSSSDRQQEEIATVSELRSLSQYDCSCD